MHFRKFSIGSHTSHSEPLHRSSEDSAAYAPQDSRRHSIGSFSTLFKGWNRNLIAARNSQEEEYNFNGMSPKRGWEHNFPGCDPRKNNML